MPSLQLIMQIRLLSMFFFSLKKLTILTLSISPAISNSRRMLKSDAFVLIISFLRSRQLKSFILLRFFLFFFFAFHTHKHRNLSLSLLRKCSAVCSQLDSSRSNHIHKYLPWIEQINFRVLACLLSIFMEISHFSPFESRF